MQTFVAPARKEYNVFHNISDELDDMARKEQLKELSSETGIAARRARYKLRRPGHEKAITSCPEGHSYTSENTLFQSSGRRQCLKCLAAKRIYKDKSANGNYPVIQLPFNEDGYQTRSKDLGE